MSEMMSALCEHAKVTKIVDVGSGKAYLSQVLAAMKQNLKILAIDSQSENLQGAQKRSANLEVRIYSYRTRIFHKGCVISDMKNCSDVQNSNPSTVGFVINR